MAFKTDWSFLDKISMGAAGTQAVIDRLNDMGHEVIELERYCTSNKIWATKIKRLRIPDLLCLRCGRRIESRAKSKLGIIMSDSEHNEERRWFCGLRDNDWVAFVQCFRNTENQWTASDTVNLFSIGGMKETESQSKLGQLKSVFEGSERDRTWACYSPGYSGTVIAIENEPDGGNRLRLRGANGRNRSKRLSADQYIYVDVGDTFTEDARILAGVVPPICNCGCGDDQYDFFGDLTASDNETVYIAVKALGFLPMSSQTIQELQRVARAASMDSRIRLEAYASMLRLGIDLWEEMYQFAFSLESIELKTEYVLILGELANMEAAEILFRILQDESNSEELRAAAVWSLKPLPAVLSRAVPFCFASEQIVANHAIAKMKRHFCTELTSSVINEFCDDDHRNAVCAYLLATANNVDYMMVFRRYLEAEGTIRNWMLYTIGISRKECYAEYIEVEDPNAAETKTKLMLLWDCHPASLSGTQIDSIAFLEQQK